LHAALNEVQQSLYAETGIEKPDHVLDREAGLLACMGKFFDGSSQYGLLHGATSP
jgi:hypothetical protein